MAEVVDRPAPRVRAEQEAPQAPALSLFWRLFLGNGVVFAIGATVLALSPATVSTPVVLAELAVLAAGLVLILAVNAVLTRAVLRPLDGLTALMRRVDLLRPGERVDVSGAVGRASDVSHLVRGFNAMLDRLEAEREEATARALAAQEGERQRIARELHDEVGQSLTAVLLGLKRTVDRAPAELRDELRAAQETIRASLDEVRQVARRLRPGVLDDLGLVSALAALAADVEAASGVPVACRLDQVPAMGPDAELVVYRIAQEGLTNIARHARASRAELSLRRVPGGVELAVVDDGRGCAGAPEGAGVRGMRERALLAGACLVIEERPEGGTVVRLRVPVREGGKWRS